MAGNKSRFSSKNNFSYAVKTLRRFADGFDAKDGFDIRKGYEGLTPYQKRKLREYVAVVEEQTARPFKVVRPRKEKRLRELQKFSQQEKNLRGLKVAFVPVGDPSAPLEVKYDKNDQVVETIEDGQIIRREIPFDVNLLISDPVLAAADVLDKAGPVNRLVMQAGAYEIPRAFSANQEALLKEIVALQEKYGADKYDETDKNSKYFGNWMFGVIAYRFKSQTDWAEFQRERRKVKDLLSEARSSKTSKKRQKEILTKLRKEYSFNAVTRNKRR